MNRSAPASPPKIVCLGETLWDLLPAGPRIGGAPLNVAYHANRLGGVASIVSRIGQDPLGGQLAQFVGLNGLDALPLQVDEKLSTGTVPVTFRDRESPSYEIVQPVAWDRIDATPAVRQTVREADALVFGTLAFRSAYNQQTLLGLLPLSPLRILDVNLREPFYSADLVQHLLGLADIVKVNDEELGLIADWYDIGGSDESVMARLAGLLNLRAVLLTRGKDGAALFNETGFHERPGRPVTVADTIGAGDAFLAGFLTKFLAGAAAETCLSFAGAVGALVASRIGGTPDYDISEVQAMAPSNFHGSQSGIAPARELTD